MSALFSAFRLFHVEFAKPREITETQREELLAIHLLEVGKT